MGKLKSNLLLLALAFGEEGWAGGAASPPPRCRQLPCRWATAGTSPCPCCGVPSAPEVWGLRRVQTLFLRRQKYTHVLVGHLENSARVVCSAEDAEE